MKITIEVPDEHVHGALAGPHSRYWAGEMDWNTERCTGYVIECPDDGSNKRHRLSATRLGAGLVAMAKHNPSQFAALLSGDYDGITGDVLLQFMTFGEEKYG